MGTSTMHQVVEMGEAQRCASTMVNGPLCVFWGPLGQLDRAATHNIQVTAGVYRPACISEYFPIVGGK